MSANFRLERLGETNFADYEKLTGCEGDGGCFCAAWHQKISSIAEWKRRCREAPLSNRDTVLSKVRAGFHVGVLAYEGDWLLGWISISPLPETYWTWPRVARLGEEAGAVAGISCITLAPSERGRGLGLALLAALADYGRTQGWRAIEGYPFDEAALAQHGDKFSWPGVPRLFLQASFTRVDTHWSSAKDYPRSIFRRELG